MFIPNQLEKQLKESQPQSGSEAVSPQLEALMESTVGQLGNLLSLAIDPFSDRVKQQLADLPEVHCPQTQAGSSFNYKLDQPRQFLKFTDETKQQHLNLRKVTTHSNRCQQFVESFYPEHLGWYNMMLCLEQNFEPGHNLVNSERISFYTSDDIFSFMEVEKKFRSDGQIYRQASLKVGENLNKKDSAWVQLVYNFDVFSIIGAPHLNLHLNFPKLAAEEFQTLDSYDDKAKSSYNIVLDDDEHMTIQPIYQPRAESVNLANLQAANQHLLSDAIDTTSEIIEALNQLQLRPAA